MHSVKQSMHNKILMQWVGKTPLKAVLMAFVKKTGIPPPLYCSAPTIAGIVLKMQLQPELQAWFRDNCSTELLKKEK